MNVKMCKEILKNEKIPYWRLAKEIGLSETSVYRMMRDEESFISVEDEHRILSAINQINKERHTIHE